MGSTAVTDGVLEAIRAAQMSARMVGFDARFVILGRAEWAALRLQFRPLLRRDGAAWVDIGAEPAQVWGLTIVRVDMEEFFSLGR